MKIVTFYAKIYTDNITQLISNSAFWKLFNISSSIPNLHTTKNRKMSTATQTPLPIFINTILSPSTCGTEKSAICLTESPTFRSTKLDLFDFLNTKISTWHVPSSHITMMQMTPKRPQKPKFEPYLDQSSAIHIVNHLWCLYVLVLINHCSVTVLSDLKQLPKLHNSPANELKSISHSAHKNAAQLCGVKDNAFFVHSGTAFREQMSQYKNTDDANSPQRDLNQFMKIALCCLLFFQFCQLYCWIQMQHAPTRVSAEMIIHTPGEGST